ncbi:GNAT family N-acetyltransferase [Cellulosimicrobium sp. Marseille-Q8652]
MDDGRGVVDERTPTLDAPPVRLRAWRPDDAHVVVEASQDPLIPLVTTVPRTADPCAVDAYVARQRRRLADGVGYSFVVATAEDDRAVGQLSVLLRDVDHGRVGIGYWVAASRRRRGYAGAALRAAADWALGLPGVQRADLFVEPWNEGSWRAAEGAGFVREGLLRGWQRVGGERRDMYVYGRLID